MKLLGRETRDGLKFLLIFAALLLEAFQLTALSIEFGLIGVDLALLLRLPDLLPLELIADQRTSAETQGSPDCSARSRMANSGSDQAAGSGAAQSADSRAFFTSTQ